MIAPPRLDPRLTITLARLRWVIPVGLSLAGIGYTAWETLVVDRYSPLSAQAVIGLALLGLVGPLLTFWALGWIVQAGAISERWKEAQIQEHEHLRALNAIGEAVNRSLDLPSVLNESLDRVLAVMGLQSGEVRLIEDNHLTLKAARQVSPAFLAAEAVVPLGQCLCGKAAQRGELIAVEDLGRTPGFAQSACTCDQFRSVLSVPIRTAERVVGLIHVASKEPRPFQPAERDLLTAIGYQVGVAIEKAQLHEKLKALNRDLEARIASRTAELEQTRTALAEKADALGAMLTEERRIEEKTRGRIANDLHDGVQQLIVGALFETQAARELLATQPDMAAAKLVSVQELLRHTEVEMRGAIYSLRPVALDAHGLVAALRECVTRHERLTHRACTLTVEGQPRRFDPEAELVAFRIAQEALNNVEMHAQASHTSVTAQFDEQGLRLAIADDGVGFDADAISRIPRAHLGLIGMRERAESIGGRLTIRSRVGQGTRVTLQVPIRDSRFEIRD